MRGIVPDTPRRAPAATAEARHETSEDRAWADEWRRTAPHQLNAATRALLLTVDEIRVMAYLGSEPDEVLSREDGRFRPRQPGTDHRVGRDDPLVRALAEKGLVEFTAPDRAWLTPLGIDVHFNLWFPFAAHNSIASNYRLGAYSLSIAPPARRRKAKRA